MICSSVIPPATSALYCAEFLLTTFPLPRFMYHSVAHVFGASGDTGAGATGTFAGVVVAAGTGVVVAGVCPACICAASSCGVAIYLFS